MSERRGLHLQNGRVDLELRVVEQTRLPVHDGVDEPERRRGLRENGEIGLAIDQLVAKNEQKRRVAGLALNRLLIERVCFLRTDKQMKEKNGQSEPHVHRKRSELQRIVRGDIEQELNELGGQEGLAGRADRELLHDGGGQMDQIGERERIEGVRLRCEAELLDGRSGHSKSGGERSGRWVAVQLDEVGEKRFDEVESGRIRGGGAETKKHGEKTGGRGGDGGEGDEIGEGAGELGVGETEEKKILDGGRDWKGKEEKIGIRLDWKRE